MQQTDNAPTPALSPDQPPPKTRGEMVFNAISWGLFGWIANAALSIKLADLAAYKYRPFFVENSAKLAETYVFKGIFKDQKERSAIARTFFSVVALMPGGFAILAPIKWMEDSKRTLVEGIDNVIGPSNPSDEKKKQIEARYEFIDHSPKIGWWDLIKGRIAPVTAVLITHISFASRDTNIPNGIAKLFGSKKRFEGLDKAYGQLADHTYQSMKTTETLGISKTMTRAEAMLDKGMEQYIANAPEKNKHHYYKQVNGSTSRLTGQDRVHEFVANSIVDIAYSAFVAASTFIASHFFAFKSEMSRENKLPNSTAVNAHKAPKFHLQAEPSIESRPDNSKPLVQVENAVYAEKIMHNGMAKTQRA